MDRQGQFYSGKKIYTWIVRSAKGFNAYQHMNPYQFLDELNLTARQSGLDIEFVEVKYHQSRSKAQKSFDLNDTNRYDFQIEQNYNKVFNTSHAFLDKLFQNADKLERIQNNDTAFDLLIEQIKKKQEDKKISDIDSVLTLIMGICEDQIGNLQSDQLKSFDKLKKMNASHFKQGQYDVFVKAKMSEPVKLKLQQNKQANKPLIVKFNKVDIKCLFSLTNAHQESALNVQELIQISNWTLGCYKPQEIQKKTPETKLNYYFSTQKFKEKVQKVNKAIQIKTLIALNKDNDSIKSFELQTYFFNETIIKTHLNMGQIKQIYVYNGRTQEGVIQYYFCLAYPPKFFISQLRQEVAQTQNYITSWQRVENFLFLRNNRINKNDFLRLFLFNNSILRVSIQKSKGYNFEKSEQMLRLIISKFDDKITVPYHHIPQKLQFKWRIKSLQASFDYSKGFQKRLLQLKQKNKVWIFKYFILIMVRYNHLYPSEINKIIQEIELSHSDLNYYIYVFWKIATDIWGYNDKNKRFAEYVFDEVKRAKSLEREHTINKIFKNSSTITQVFRLNSTPSGFLYAPPTPEMKGRLLKQFDKESQYFMRISICDDHQGTLKNQKYITKSALKSKMLKFEILGREYVPLGWSPSQLRAYSLWYMHQTHQTQSKRRLTREYVLNFLGNFQDIDNPARRAARIGQSFSSSWTFNASKIKYIPQKDIQSEGKFLFTDGIGRISKDLIQGISLQLGLNQLSIIQIRYRGAKGILVLDEDLPKNTIVLRDSMIKYKCDNIQAIKYLDILDYNKYKAGFLNRQVIILLKTLKIKDEVFKQLQKTHITNVSQMSFKDCSVFKQMNDDLNTEVNNLQPANRTILQLVRAGFQLENQPFFRGVLETMKKNGYYQLKTKCNIRVEKSARIIGIIDEFGVLNEKEIYCAIYDPFSNRKDSEKLQIIEGKAIITRNPCLDPADIRLVKCIGEAEIATRFDLIGKKNKFQKLVNCVIFPQKGKVPLTAQISGSDLDGDNFFVCWDENLIPKQLQIRTIKTIDNPNDNKKKKTQKPIKKQQQMYKQMMDFFFEYINYEKLGQIDNSHLVKADKDDKNYAENSDCMKLCQIHGKAVDFPKTGYCPEVDPKLLTSDYPDFMQKVGYETYPSKSILGQLYRDIKQKIQNLLEGMVYKEEESIDSDLVKYLDFNFTKDEIKQAYTNLRDYEKSLSNMINLVGIDTEYEIYSGNFSIAKEKVDQYGKTRLISTILMLRSRFFEIFFQDLQDDEKKYLDFQQEHMQKQKTFSVEAKRKAILYYLVSYTYKFNEKLKYPHEKLEKIRTWVNQSLDEEKRFDRKGKFCGFVWFVVPKIMMNVKKTALLKNQMEVEESKKQKKKEKQKSDQSAGQSQRNSDNQNSDQEQVI